MKLLNYRLAAGESVTLVGWWLLVFLIKNAPLDNFCPADFNPFPIPDGYNFLGRLTSNTYCFSLINGLCKCLSLFL